MKKLIVSSPRARARACDVFNRIKPIDGRAYVYYYFAVSAKCERESEFKWIERRNGFIYPPLLLHRVIRSNQFHSIAKLSTFARIKEISDTSEAEIR